MRFGRISGQRWTEQACARWRRRAAALGSHEVVEVTGTAGSMCCAREEPGTGLREGGGGRRAKQARARRKEEPGTGRSSVAGGRGRRREEERGRAS